MKPGDTVRCISAVSAFKVGAEYVVLDVDYDSPIPYVRFSLKGFWHPMKHFEVVTTTNREGTG